MLATSQRCKISLRLRCIRGNILTGPKEEEEGHSYSRNFPQCMKPEGYYGVHKSPPLVTRPNQSMNPPSLLPKIYFNIIGHLRLGLPSYIFPFRSPRGILCVPHRYHIRVICPAIPFFVILSPEQYLVESANRKASRNAVSSTPSLPRSS
jgi:hypothetical protein